MNKVAKNFLSIFSGNLVSKIVAFAITIFIAREFGPDKFGQINFANAFITYFALISNAGLPSLGIIQITKNKNNIKYFVDELVSLRIILSFCAYLVLIVAVIFLDKSMQDKIMILISGLTILGTSFYLEFVFNAIQDMKFISYASILNSLVSSGIIFILAATKIYNNIFLVPIAYAVASFISSIYLLKVYKVNLNLKFKFIFKFKNAIEDLRNAWPFFFSGVFANINYNIDTLILGFLRTNVEVGYYNAVYKIVNIFMLIVMVIFTPVYPLLIEYFNSDKSKLTFLVNNLRKLILIISVPVFFAAFIINKETVITLYGQDYQKASMVFLILTVYIALFFIREIYGYELSAWGLQKKYMNIVLISSMYNVVANLILIPKFGINGAAFNTLISESINLILMYRISRKALKIKYDNTYLYKLLISAICMSGVIILLKNITANAIILAAAGIIVYILLVFMLKATSLKELKELLSRKG